MHMNTWIAGKYLIKHYYLKIFSSSLNMKNITIVDYRHAKRVFKDFMICMFEVIHFYF